jgi:hypothetical protein
MHTMNYKGYKARIMEAERIRGNSVYSLPPGKPLSVYHSDSFKCYPDHWMKGPGVFVIPVKPNKGIWFNFRMNDELNTAVIMTVKGCNPITGLQTSGFHLERYDNKCPKHNCDFQADRFCPECNYKWPDRNYLSMSPLWWDGWITNGSVRQFFFTEELMRDIATHMIGKENTVPAFGFAFYSPKEPRVSTVNITRGINAFNSYIPPDNCCISNSLNSISYPAENKFSKGIRSGIKRYRGYVDSNVKYSSPILEEKTYGGIISEGSSADSNRIFLSANLDSLAQEERSYVPDNLDSLAQEKRSYVPEKEVSIGAGAKIDQKLTVDSYSLNTWKDKPDSVMTLYFVFQEEFDKMASAGLKDLEGKKEGMLDGLPVG